MRNGDVKNMKIEIEIKGIEDLGKRKMINGMIINFISQLKRTGAEVLTYNLLPTKKELKEKPFKTVNTL